jgi:hypothetical protein
MEKGSPIFNLCLKSLRLFRPNLTWIPGNGKKINVWEDSVLGDPPLSSMEGLDRLKSWMRAQDLTTLWDISVWSEGMDKTWLRWEANNRPQELEGEWNTLMGYLQGKSLIKARKKDKRGWGSLSGNYTTTTGYKILTVVPHVPPDPTIWKSIWTSKSIPKIDMFVWTLAHRSILTGRKSVKERVGRPIQMSTLHTRRGNIRPSALAMPVR